MYNIDVTRTILYLIFVLTNIILSYTFKLSRCIIIFALRGWKITVLSAAWKNELSFLK